MDIPMIATIGTKIVEGLNQRENTKSSTETLDTLADIQTAVLRLIELHSDIRRDLLSLIRILDRHTDRLAELERKVAQLEAAYQSGSKPDKSELPR